MSNKLLEIATDLTMRKIEEFLKRIQAQSSVEIMNGKYVPKLPKREDLITLAKVLAIPEEIALAIAKLYEIHLISITAVAEKERENRI